MAALSVALILAQAAGLAASRMGHAADTRPVDAARIEDIEGEARNWLSTGRTYSELRFSPLNRINAENAQHLGLAWYSDLNVERGQEATPIVVDGVMYLSTAWSLVKAYDARTGKILWSYDPQVPRNINVNACCDVVNRGVAVWQGKVFVGAFDGRLIALDAKSGRPVWTTWTVDRTRAYTITQAPRVVKGRVIIGNGGGEYATRGYISAYDAADGTLAWRFYTVPGDPAKPFENEAMARAAKTWSGDWWKLGGGGAAWDAISYDPTLNLIYFGVGNGIQWDQGKRSQNKGDNLFLSSIVAVNADTGAYVWHYQATPGDEWDFDAVQQLALADLTIDGTPRQVLMQANKNGFFYLLDRRTGALISAQPIVPVTWASGVDAKSGRPLENAGIRYSETGRSASIMPGPVGAHSWQPMSYNPATGLVYIPTQQVTSVFEPLGSAAISPIGWNIGVGMRGSEVKSAGFLLAWDPVRQKEAWRVQQLGPWNGGTATTAGNIVAQGDAAGNFNVYRADNGQRLWSMFVQSGVMAAPSVYEIDGEEYIAVLSGWGGAFALSAGKGAAQSGNLQNVSRVLAFKLGASAVLPASQPRQLVITAPPEPTDSASIARGEPLFGQYCSVCHGGGAASGGLTQDLRASKFLASDTYYDIVLGGLMKDEGMVSFKKVLSKADATAVRNYIIHRANEDVKHPGAPDASKEPERR
jgi:quinohemoprotein ethanol dehydrogenase